MFLKKLIALLSSHRCIYSLSGYNYSKGIFREKLIFVKLTLFLHQELGEKSIMKSYRHRDSTPQNRMLGLRKENANLDYNTPPNKPKM